MKRIMVNSVKRFLDNTYRYRRILVSICLWILVVNPVGAVQVNVSVDRNPVQLNESFNLIFSAAESPDGEPDFSVLDDQFEIINQSQSSNISVINGNYRKQITWTLSVMAKHAGKLVIPPVRFGDDTSTPASINVSASAPAVPSQNEELFLQVSAEPKNPYVQAQVLYTVQFFRRVDIAQASLGDPVLPGAVVEKLGEDSHFTTERDGEYYSVTQRQYAIFPQQSGAVKIEPLVLTADVLTSRRGGFFSRQLTHSKRIVSNAIDLQVRPVPDTFTGKHWLPAEELHLSEEWSVNPPSVNVGEPVTRTVTLLAKGTQASQLPDLPPLRLAGKDAKSIKQYPDKPVLREKKQNEGVISFREQKVALIPAKGGKYEINGIEIPWWNTEADRMEVAKLPSAVIQGVPSAQTNNLPQPVLSEPENTHQQEPTDSTKVTATNNEEAESSIWKWSTLVLAIAWLLTLVVWFISNRRQVPVPIQTELTHTKRNLLRELKKACRDNNPAQAKDRLLDWAKLEWPDSPPANLAALASHCNEELAGEIQRLSRILYSRGAEKWLGDDCWRAFSALGATQSNKKVSNTTGLEPLFKI